MGEIETGQNAERCALQKYLTVCMKIYRKGGDLIGIIVLWDLIGLILHLLVKQIGEDVKSDLHRNQRVMPVLFWDNLLKKGNGSWQSYVDVAEENVFPLPEVSKESADYVPDEVAAQFVITAWTALGLFHTAVAGIQEGRFLLLSAPSSTIGR